MPAISPRGKKDPLESYDSSGSLAVGGFEPPAGAHAAGWPELDKVSEFRQTGRSGADVRGSSR